MIDVALRSKIDNLIKARNYKSARSLCETYSKNNPNDAEAYYLLGTICGQQGDLGAAEIALMKAFPIAPNHPDLNYNLGLVLFKQNKNQDAIEYFARTVQLDPSQFDGWLYLGQASALLGNRENAIISYKHALSINPDSEVVLKKLALLYFEFEKWLLAIDAYERLFKISPNDVNVVNKLCGSLCRAYQYERLIKLFEPIANKNPRNHLLNYYLGEAYFAQSEIKKAEVFFDRVLKQNPNHVAALTALISIKAIGGEYEAAWNLLRPLVKSHPHVPAVAQAYALIGARFGKEDDVIRLLQLNLDNTGLEPIERSATAIALGRVYEKRTEFDKAFELFKLGNDLYSPEFDCENYKRGSEVLKSIYTEESIGSLPVSSVNTDVPIFIVGMPRSGTSLVEQIIASHPKAFGAGELKYLQNYTFELNELKINNKQYPFCMEDVSQAELDRLANDYLDQLNNFSNGEDKVTDKMPLNYQNIGLIYQLFPNAKIINCTRDPLDICVSCYSQFLSGAYLYSFNLYNLGFVYRVYEKLMAHWKKILPVEIIDISYEELVHNQEDMTRKILGHCGLDWADECLDFYNTKRSVATASVDQVRQSIYTGSIGKWRNYDKHLDLLKTSLDENA